MECEFFLRHTRLPLTAIFGFCGGRGARGTVYWRIGICIAEGKQSATPYAFHMLPPNAVFAAAEVARQGAEKYGETL